MAVNFIVGEYHVLWEALKHYEQHLLEISEHAQNEEDQILADDKLLKLEGMFKDVRDAARQDWQLELK